MRGVDARCQVGERIADGVVAAADKHILIEALEHRLVHSEDPLDAFGVHSSADRE